MELRTGASLTPEEREQFIQRVKSGERVVDVCNDFNVRPTSIYSIGWYEESLQNKSRPKKQKIHIEKKAENTFRMKLNNISFSLHLNDVRVDEVEVKSNELTLTVSKS
jgi:hypothetical protein